MGSSIDRIARLAETARAGVRGLQVTIEDVPTPEFDRALDELVPTDDAIDRWVHTELAKTTRTPKRNIVVRHRGLPVLATTLRARQDRWEIATAAVAPTLRIPHRDGFLESALSATGLRILIQDYFGDARTDFRRQHLKPFDSYIAELTEFDFEAYWRSTKVWDTIRRVERRTSHLAIVHDDPAVLAWSIDRWEARWTGDQSDEAGAADDMRNVWPELMRQGVVTSTALVDQDGSPLASNVNLIDGDTLVGLISARDLSLPVSLGSVGTRVELECWNAARGAGLSRVDIGGYHEYKRRLTPAGRVAYEVEIAPRIIAPATLLRARRTAGRAKRAMQAVLRPRP